MNRISRAVLSASALTLFGCGSEQEISQVADTQAPLVDAFVSTNANVLEFNPGTWGLLRGTATLSFNQGTLAISNFGSSFEIQSNALGNLVDAPKITVEAVLPTPTGAWGGALKLYIDLPSQGINGVMLGVRDLTGLAAGTRSFEFDVPSSVQLAMAGRYSDLRFRVGLDVPTRTDGGTYGFKVMSVGSCRRSDLTLSRWPVPGVNGKDYFINNYTDLDSAGCPVTTPPTPCALRRDYTGVVGLNARNYDGHRGIDIDTPSFREMWDDTARILAAADGRVEEVVESEPDENVAAGNIQANLVRIRARNGYRITYAHVQTNSVLPQPGDYVRAGDFLAHVGSSGGSTNPHLHFEVEACPRGNQTLQAVEPYGILSTPPASSVQTGPSMWPTEVEYVPASRVMRVYLWDNQRTPLSDTDLSHLKVARQDQTAFGQNATIRFFAVFGVRNRDRAACVAIDPAGVSTNLFTAAKTDDRYGRGGWYAGFATSGRAIGRWRVRCTVTRDGVLRDTLERTFSIGLCAPGQTECVVRGIRSADYQAVFQTALDANYRPAWVDGYTVNNAAFINVVFKPNDGRFVAAAHGLDATGYQAEFERRAGEGLRLAQVDSYLDQGAVRYAALWDDRAAPTGRAFHALSDAQFTTLWNEYTGLGYQPRLLSSVSPSTGRTHAGLFELTGVRTGVRRDTREVDYQTTFNSLIGQGYEPITFDGYVHQGVTRFATLWAPLRSRAVWARHNATAAELDSALAEQRSRGFSTIVVSGYQLGAEHRYAAIATIP